MRPADYTGPEDPFASPENCQWACSNLGYQVATWGPNRPFTCVCCSTLDAPGLADVAKLSADYGGDQGALFVTASTQSWDLYTAPGVELTFRPTPAPTAAPTSTTPVPTASPTPVECRRRLLERRRRRRTATSYGRGGSTGNNAGNTRSGSTGDAGAAEEDGGHDDTDAGVAAFVPLNDDEANILNSCEGAQPPPPPGGTAGSGGGGGGSGTSAPEIGHGGPPDPATTSFQDVLEECERERGEDWAWTCSDTRLRASHESCLFVDDSEKAEKARDMQG